MTDATKSFLTISEWIAVVFSILFTYLIAQEIRFSWIFGGSASIIYVFLVWRKGLWAETALHVFYMVMAVIGFISWTETDSGSMAQSTVSINDHLMYIITGVTLTTTVGFLLKKTPAKTPFLDAFTTVFSILATLLMVQYVRENWLYWIAIDASSIFLYAYRKMWPTTLLFIIYTGMAIYAYWSWAA